MADFDLVAGVIAKLQESVDQLAEVVARLPADLADGRLRVDGGQLQPLTLAQLAAAGLGLDATQQATLAALQARLPSVLAADRLKVDHGQLQPLTQAQLAAAGLSLEETQLVVAGIAQAALDTPLSGRAAEATQQSIYTRLGDLLTAMQAIAIDADSIAIDADTINLNTDALENLLAAVRDRLPASVGQKISAAALAVVLSTEQEAILASAVDKLASISARLPSALSGDRLKVETQHSQALTDAQLRVSAVPVSGPLTDAQLRASALPVQDDYQATEHEADQDGAGGVLAFPLSAAAQFVVVDVDNSSDSDTVTYRARATLDGSTPSETEGFVCRSGQSTCLPFPTAGTVKVWAPTGVVVSVQAGRR